LTLIETKLKTFIASIITISLRGLNVFVWPLAIISLIFLQLYCCRWLSFINTLIWKLLVDFI
jgi:hypothetical protein